MYIEELIQFTVGSGPWLFKHGSLIAGHDHTILDSMANQLAYNQGQLTEKQGTLALRILSKNRDKIITQVPTLDQLLKDPKWKFPFRVLPKNKKISIVTDNSNSKILVEFPFDESIVESLRQRNQEVHELYKGMWDHEIKKWTFPLTENTIDYIGKNLLDKEFQADDEFISLYTQIKEVHESIENVLPMLVETSNGFEIKNAHKKIEQPQTNTLVEALFWARDYGITCWDDSIDLRIKNELNPITTAVVSSAGRKHVWFDSTKVNIDNFSDLINYGGPALIIVPGGSGIEQMRQWNEFASRLGITAEEMSVMFRLPNEQSEFNIYVKENNLNNPISEKTRMAFVSTKITKPLIKSGIRFNTIINLGYYQYMHFTMSTVVENAQNLVYYSMKEPVQNKRWQPHEL
jgi:hypothetical protein